MEKKQSYGTGGDGVAWLRGPLLGKGGYATVYLATSRTRNGYFPKLMAVKSAEVSVASSLQKERNILNNLHGCPHILRCYGEETTTSENGEMVCNILLEYASGGTLADLLNRTNRCGLQESDVKRYTRYLLLGLNHIHECGYVHRDLKPENILLVPSKRNGTMLKIGDFGVAKRSKVSLDLRGTPMYLSPEAVTRQIQEQPSDIWALGCVVLEMLTGKWPWDMKPDYQNVDVMNRIGQKHESPIIPSDISKEGKDFLRCCFTRNPEDRLTADRLLNHPFIAKRFWFCGRV